MMSLDEWAFEQAARVVEDVERHGVGITWSEAHRRLLEVVRFLNLPVHVDQGGGVLRPLEPVERRQSGSAATLPRRWRAASSTARASQSSLSNLARPTPG
jgi:hypothetical protein